MEAIFQLIKERCQSGEAVTLVLVVESSDGTPRKAGAKMLVGAEGSLYGTVGGGNIEYRAIQTAKKLTETGSFHCEEYVLHLDDEKKLGMTCGGNTKPPSSMCRGQEGLTFAEKGLQMCAEKSPYCMAVPMAEGTAEILDMQSYHSRRETMERNAVSCYTEFFLHEGKVYIFGGGHVAYELLPVLTKLGFRCVLLDDREEYANAVRFPDAEEIHLVDYQNLDLPIQKEDFAVIMTRGHQFDAHCERFVLGTKASYIGVMGSRKKADYIRTTLLAEGFSEESLNRITTPIGLSISSETPQEIAISIAAQLIQVRAELRKKGASVMIYLDNAATTAQKPKEVAEAMMEALRSTGNAGRGVNAASLKAARMIYETRERLAELFHAESPLRIAFTNNVTESLNIAIKGLFEEGDHVITTVMEHNSVLRPLYEIEANGVELTFLSCDEKGRLCLEELEKSILPHTKAFICTHASNLTGNVNDLCKIGTICKKHGLLLIVDAAQTAGLFPIDVQEMGIDVLCFTGHKSLYGPQGTGGLYVREGLEIRPLKSGGSGVDSFNKEHPGAMPTRLEAGTLNTPGIAGLGTAVAFLQEIGMEAIRKKEEELWKYFYRNIKDIKGIRFLGDLEAETHAPIVTFNFMDYDSAEISDELWDCYGIATRAGAHCAPLMHRTFGTEEQGAVRFSFSYFNMLEEVQHAVEAVKEVCCL